MSASEQNLTAPSFRVRSGVAEGEQSSRRRETLLRLPIGDLVTWQLVASCGTCRTDRVVMVRDLVDRFGPDARLVMLVPRLRCRVKACRRVPSCVVLRNRCSAAANGPRLVEMQVA